MQLTCFKAYDIRGRVGENLDDAIARRIGTAFAYVMSEKVEGDVRIVVGRDCRESSPALAEALIEGLLDQGADVLDIGLAGTEEVYFATAHLGAAGGLEVTASHNPKEYNGMKMVGPSSRPLDPIAELAEIRHFAEQGELPEVQPKGRYATTDVRAAYAAHVCDFIDPDCLKPLRIVVNAGNGTAGPAFDAIAGELHRRGAPLSFIRVNHEADGRFPNGVPNPILRENHSMTAEPVKAEGADIGVAWDGDFDRCFLFDDEGNFVDGEYIVALLAESFLLDRVGETIVYDPRVVWNTRAAVDELGGTAVMSRTGHAFMKAKMREVNAVYGGEMSAHHYFRDFAYCDSGMIPWLKLVEFLSRIDRSLSNAVSHMRQAYPSSGEINFAVPDPQAAVEAVVTRLGPEALTIDSLDGASLTFDNWRMNLRASNTEPLLRLNVETRGDRELLHDRVSYLTDLIERTACASV
ncbi:phosphomannomutase [Rhodovulum adriaticum]|uniref:Phosphomannomutase n=1 Tax=Rhodovulum adriaticum TaxID=35804 RepID=A0A4V2SKP2_RHOAD|nr:phosphomannomutase [Rhodovulum adriaticum]MBK1637251.1 phosphomannomutase [Rhodovulum adriaticum]TCP20226.1 phosphomannomutase [Rhodovulum adriaticum]